MKHVIESTQTLRSALEVLELLHFKLLFVVDANKVLMGSLTDGDIRRAIIDGHQPDEAVVIFMNNSPLFAKKSDSTAYKLSLFEQLPLILLPIVNDKLQLLELVSKADLGSLPNKVVLMAGGLGSRLKELTKDTPKPLLKVGSKPILHSIIEQFSANDLKQFYISVNYKREMIKEYFSGGEQLGVDIKYIEETKRLGTAGCLSLIDEVFEQPLFVMNADVLVEVDFKSMLAFHTEGKFAATMGVIEYNVDIPYGVVAKDSSDKLESITEKPSIMHYVSAGVYILEPEVLASIPENSFYDMPTLISELQKSDKSIGVYSKLSNWIDIGHVEDYYKAQERYK